MFYPYGSEPDEQSERVRPVSVDPKTQQNVYQCGGCKELILEEDVEKWYTEKSKEEDVSYKMPPYNYENILQVITQVSQYLLPFYNQLLQYLKDENLTNEQSDYYGNDEYQALRRWEVQVPQLPEILRNSQELIDICSFQYRGYGNSGICGLFNTTEISGDNLRNLSDIILNPEQEAKQFMEYSSKQFGVPRSYPLCYDCLGSMIKCEFCDKQIFPDDRKYQTTWSDTDYICEKCVEGGEADTCIECGKADTPSDMHWREDEGILCSDCYKNLAEESIGWAEEQIANLDIPVGKNLPLSSKVLNSLHNFIERYIKKYGDKELNQKEMGRLKYVGSKSGLPNGAIEYLNNIEETYMSNSDRYEVDSVKDIFDDLENNLKAQEYMQEQYPNLKSYQDLPFDIEVMPNYSDEKPGFTIGITPSEEFFDYAIKKHPNIRSVWNQMSNTPHHSGVLAYARCAYEMGDSLVINNLQRDSDYDNFVSRSFTGTSPGSHEAAKWMDQITKNWDSFLLNLIKSICILKNVSAYLTTFDQQRDKWHNIPIYKSKKSYEEVPERMGFPLSSPEYGAENLTERGGDGDMYQIANDIGQNWYKKANN